MVAPSVPPAEISLEHPDAIDELAELRVSLEQTGVEEAQNELR